MTGEWTKVTLEQIKAPIPNAIAMGPFGSRIKTDNFVPSGVPVIRGGNLNASRLLDDEFVYLTEEKADELRASNAQPGDIVITHRGTIGQVGIIPYSARHPRYVVSQSQMKFTVDPKKADPFFIFYFLRSPVGQHQLLANTSQVGVPAIAQPTSSLKAIEVLLPPTVNEQRTIAHILGMLDDKIELNRRMNETLEAIARTIFKSWFVDFDPVRAKASGEPPESICRRLRLTLDLLAFFPNRLVDSELGEIPEEWKIGTLGDVAEHPRRGIQPAEIAAATPYIALEHMPRRCIALSDWNMADGLESNKFQFRKGEILFGKLRPYFHKVGVAPISGVCSTDIVVVTPKAEGWFGFVLGHISSDAFVEHTNAGSTGTKMPRTSWKDMARYQIVIPPDALSDAYTRLVCPIFDRIIASIHERRTLTALRDTLLPKLLSGELRVPETVGWADEGSPTPASLRN